MHESELKAVHAALIATGVFVPLPRDSEEQHRWMDYDLASFAENHLGEAADPEALDNPTRARWLATALDAPLCTPRQRRAERCYWIMHDRTRAGTLALSRFCLGRFAMAYSVYLRPQHRGQRIMANAIEAVCAHLAAHDLGLRLETPWTWQRAVRFYLRTGFWLCSWKRDLAFVRRPRQPRPVVHVTPRTISVAVEVEGTELELAHAQRDGVGLIDHGASPNVPESLVDLAWDAQTTLALALALHGWPLVRSGDRFEQARYSDLVHRGARGTNRDMGGLGG